MRFVDLFAGLGGFHIAATSLGGRCVFACEINDRLRGLYNKNFGVFPAKDIRHTPIHKIPDHDLLCAGFPCQPFSKAGAQTGLEDKTRGAVFFKIPEILQARRPEFLILENVPHFVNHDSGRTYSKLQRSLEQLGYDISVKQFSPHDFGIPQYRQRIYLIGRLNGLNGYRWPQINPRRSRLSIRDVLDVRPDDARLLGDRAIRCLETWQEFLEAFPANRKLPSFPIWSMEFGATYPYEGHDSLGSIPLKELRRYRGAFGRSMASHFRRDVLAALPRYAQGHHDVFPRWKRNFIAQNRTLYRENKSWVDSWLPKIKEYPPSYQKLEWNCQGEERDIWKFVIQFRASGVRVKRPTMAPSLVAMTSSQVPIVAWEKRYMSARECARLQSMETLEHLPQWPHTVKALGNAVNVEVVRRIMARLLMLE